MVWSLGMVIKDDSLKEGAYRFHIKKEKYLWHAMGREKKLALSSAVIRAWEGLGGCEGFPPGKHLGLISNAVYSVQPMGSWPRPCSRLTCPLWAMPPAPAPPTGAPLWRKPWCALEEMEFALDARWTHVGSVKCPIPGPSPLCLPPPTFSSPTILHSPMYRLNFLLWCLNENDPVLVTLFSLDLKVDWNLKINLA